MEAGCKSGFCCAQSIVKKLAGMDGSFVNYIVDNSGAGGLFEGTIQVMFTDIESLGQKIQSDIFSQMVINIIQNVGNGLGDGGRHRRGTECLAHQVDLSK